MNNYRDFQTLESKVFHFPYLAVMAILGQRLTFLDTLEIHVEVIAYFSMDYLVHLGSKVALMRFQKFLYFA